MAAAQAATLTWDPKTSGGPSDGGGTWQAANVWWNGTADQTWANSSANNVIIGAGTNGTYAIVLTSAVTCDAVTISNSAYSFSGSTWTIDGAINLNSGVNAVFNGPIVNSGQTITVGTNGGSLTLGANYTSSTGNPGWHGASVSSSTLYLTNGTFTDSGAIGVANLTINQSGGILNGSGTASAMYLGFNGSSTNSTAIYNMSGGSINAVALGISRGSPGILNLIGGSIVTRGATGLRLASIDGDDVGTLNMSGGTLIADLTSATTIGVTSTSLEPISLCAASATYTANAQAIFNLSGGTAACLGLQFGSASGNYAANPICQFNMTGGLLYLDSGGIAPASGLTTFTSPVLNISGGTLAATANWTGSMPMTLTTTNGNITFQCLDLNQSPWNITLSGALTGPGGLNKTGGGILTISGIDTYTGTTVISDGEFAVDTTTGTSIGSVTMVGGTTLSTAVIASGQSWTNTGLAVSPSVTLDFNFGNVLLSSSQPVVEVAGNLTLDSSDSVTIEGSSLLQGTYPLMTCSGTFTLTGGSSLPTITSLPNGVSASLSQIGNTINLVVSSSPNNAIKWGPLASGSWDFTTPNWLNVGSGTAVDYTDGIAVDLNDDGNSAVRINLATTVNPGSVTANNTANGTAYFTIAGPGAIAGSTRVTVQGTGGLALATTNTYTGGTILNSGTLAINVGGDGVTDSPLGTGSLTINGGALDNTSGTNVVLNYPIPETWNGNFSYVGSETNLDLGLGPVTLGSSTVQVTVLSNTLSCGGAISDNGSHFRLIVQGPGALTLKGLSTYNGGTALGSGKLNINNGGDGGADSAIGIGTFSINGGTIDNTSGTNVQLETSITEVWNANFTFAGSANLDLGSGPISAQALTLTLQNGATLSTEGQITANGGGGVATMTLAGNGAFQTGGSANNTGLSMIVNGGVFQMNKSSSSAVHSIQALTVNTGGTAIDVGTGGQQVVNSSAGPVTLGGGALDLFGNSEIMYSMLFNSGTLKNSSTNPATLNMTTSINLNGAACYFDVASDSSLSIPTFITGTGSVIKVDSGMLSLGSTNNYGGSTTVSNGLLSFTTATHANGNYSVAAGELEAVLDPTGAQLQMGMSNLTFSASTRMEFDLALGNFGDTTASLVSAGTVTLNGNVAIDVTNAPADNNNDVLLTYAKRQGPGSFVAGHIPAGAFINDNTAAGTVSLTYTQPSALPAFSSVTSVSSGGALTALNFSGVGGPANGSYHILSSTNVTLRPVSAWTVVKAGSFDASGNFSNSVTVNPAVPQTFYILSVP